MNTLAVSYGVGSGEIAIHTNIKEISFDLDNAIPCALIINELVSNCIKYAFQDNSNGEIQITLIAIDKDNGIGFPEDFDFDSVDTGFKSNQKYCRASTWWKYKNR